MGKRLPGLQILLRSSRQGLIDHFTVVGLVTWLLNGSEAGVDLVSIKTLLPIARNIGQDGGRACA